MCKRFWPFFTLCTVFFAFVPGIAQEKLTFNPYHDPDAVKTLLSTWATQYPRLTRLSVMGQSAGKRDLLVLRIAARPENSVMPHSRPAVLISANVEGVHLVGTEAALMLAEKLLTGYESDENLRSLLEEKTVYIAPLLHPDAAARYFTSPRFESPNHATPTDEDADGSRDEDGPDDLDGDGLITQMRLEDPRGQWIVDPDNARLMIRIDPEKDQHKRYRVYTEGKDNDKDGRINEDPPGGIALNRNFPHILEHNLNKTDTWPDPAPETIAIIEFLTDHPNINLILHFSTENTLLGLNPMGKVLDENMTIQLPKNVAEILGVSPQDNFRLKTIQQMLEKTNMVPQGMKMNTYETAKLLGLDASLPIEKEDMDFFQRVQSDYRERLSASGFKYPDQKDRGLVRGSFLTFCYFRYGVPVFSCDPGAVLSSESYMTAQDRGFTDWKPYHHPDLGDVEIGGIVPFRLVNPPVSMIESTLSFHAEYYLRLINQMAELQIRGIDVTPLGDSTSRIRVTFSNPGWFPTCTAQGQKSQTSWPITVRLKTAGDHMIYAGEPFEIISAIPGGETRTLEWQIKGPGQSQVTLSATSFKVGTLTTTFMLR